MFNELPFPTALLSEALRVVKCNRIRNFAEFVSLRKDAGEEVYITKPSDVGDDDKKFISPKDIPKQFAVELFENHKYVQFFSMKYHKQRYGQHTGVLEGSPSTAIEVFKIQWNLYRYWYSCIFCRILNTYWEEQDSEFLHLRELWELAERLPKPSSVSGYGRYRLWPRNGINELGDIISWIACNLYWGCGQLKKTLPVDMVSQSDDVLVYLICQGLPYLYGIFQSSPVKESILLEQKLCEWKYDRASLRIVYEIGNYPGMFTQQESTSSRSMVQIEQARGFREFDQLFGMIDAGVGGGTSWKHRRPDLWGHDWALVNVSTPPRDAKTRKCAVSKLKRFPVYAVKIISGFFRS